MYVTTFYSFKGGVGRTLALVNCAFELAQHGKRVLLVDFDLEAPGISTFEPFAGCSRSLGLVDYVSTFVASGEAPDVREYVAECTPASESGGRIWLMPAGKQDAGYSSRLASLDWAALYERHDGYLMFEDLKSQWKEAFRPDYVLLDSRTGHTDVGGICTRHLPDAVVLLFFPNEQNITGLEGVVRCIREDSAPNRKPKLHFVPSRVPDLDDEGGTLAVWLERAKKRLGYSRPAAVIREYASMDLLSQAIFTQARPNSRLAKEYRKLTQAIVAENLEDRDGALAKLEGYNRLFSLADGEPPVAWPRSVESTLESIAEYHPNDGEILYRMALVREGTGNADAAVLALNKAFEAGNRSPAVHLARAAAHRMQSNSAGAADDLIAVLRDPTSAAHETVRAVTALCDVAPDRVEPGFEDLPAVGALEDEDLSQLVETLLVSAGGAQVVEALIRRRLENTTVPEWVKPTYENTLALSFIARARFTLAANLLQSEASKGAQAQLADLFNYAVAKWGERGSPDSSLFAEVVARHRRKPFKAASANYHQAIAMAMHLSGEHVPALRSLQQSEETLFSNPRSEVSAWRFLVVRPAVFLEDLQAMREWITRERGVPLFMRFEQ